MSGASGKNVLISLWAVWDSFQRESHLGIDHMRLAKQLERLGDGSGGTGQPWERAHRE